MKVTENTVHELFESKDIIMKPKSIGVPMTPSKWLSKEPAYQPISRIKMSCGGGIGGSSWYEYVKRIAFDHFKLGEMLTVETIDGEKKLLNPNFIVKVEQFTLVSASIDSKNRNYAIGEHTYRWLCLDDVAGKLTLYGEFESTV